LDPSEKSSPYLVAQTGYGPDVKICEDDVALLVQSDQ